MRYLTVMVVLTCWFTLGATACSDDSGPNPPATDGGGAQTDLPILGDASTADGAAAADAAPVGAAWKAVAAGGAHTCALRNDNSAWCWGSNSNGQLGDGTASSSPAPVRVKGLSNLSQVDADWVHSCAVTAQGTAHCWGENDGMQIGDPLAESKYVFCEFGGCKEPVQVVNITDVVAVGTGARHSCAVLRAGSAWCWGFNELGQLGDGNLPTDSASPSQVSSLQNAASISGSPWHTCAATKDGKAFCWGDNMDGNLGVEDPLESDIPIQVPGLVNVASIVAGEIHTCAHTTDGKAFCWGANGSGQLGDGTTDGHATPAQITSLSGVVSIATGMNHSCAVDGPGDVWCWGANGSDDNNDGVPDAINGKVGQPDTVDNQLTPAQVTGLSPAAAVTTGDDHTCALTRNGEIWCWGSNADGQLGPNAGNPFSTVPVKVAVPALP